MLCQEVLIASRLVGRGNRTAMSCEMIVGDRRGRAFECNRQTELLRLESQRSDTPRSAPYNVKVMVSLLVIAHVVMVVVSAMDIDRNII